MHEDRKTLDNDSLVSYEMTTMTTKCFYDKMINASNNKKKLLLLSSTAIAKVCVLQKRHIF